jgi:hypothetical protein
MINNYIEQRKQERKLEIHPEQIELIPSIMIKDPDFCFGSITEEVELEFIFSLSQEDWIDIGNENEYFELITETICEIIREKYPERLEKFIETKERDTKIDEILK